MDKYLYVFEDGIAKEMHLKAIPADDIVAVREGILQIFRYFAGSFEYLSDAGTWTLVQP